MSNAAEAEALPHRVVEQLGRIDILVNNAGVGDPRSMWDLEEGHWDRVMAVNVKGLFFCLRGAARQMREQRSGKIINLASSAGKGPAPNHLHYAASKSAVISITRSAAAELAPHGVNVNCMCPGIVDTALWVQLDETYSSMAGKPQGSVFKERVSRIPLGRAAQPLDVARVAAFLASEDSDYMTGQAVNVTGGSLMH
jgi:meso-butanediol dehydrogenase / (S,S)-butanediol dehydrogenase / diacetyl reductase